MSATVFWLASGALGAGLGVGVALSMARRVVREKIDEARIEAAALRKSARLESGALRRSAETRAREEVLAQQDALDSEIEAESERLSAKLEAVQRRFAKLEDARGSLDDRRDDLRDRESEVQRLRDRAQGLRNDIESKNAERRGRLEELCHQSGSDVAAELKARWIEEASAEAAQLVRLAEQGAGDPEAGREADRLMSIATSRYRNHFLTERSNSKIILEEGVADLLVVDNNRILDAFAEGSNVQLHLDESGTFLRLEGLDGVGREVARRALKNLGRKAKAEASAKSDPLAYVRSIRERLDNEILGLGRKAFQTLKVAKADDEIVTLVGALNFRTSYTQNQWRHAVEAAFLAGMMAEEMNLDVRLARRATLMHDIGKALTHKIEGSHAVIGADIARRLGEDEIVANAIGSHHADEPPHSVYAFLVAAADAMSGARPGARREQSDGYSTRLEDLERIGASYEGVENCYAVHGGRELRIYINDKEISDVGAVDLSSEIADHIAEEMTFPGQIKVTVIRSTEAVSVAS